MTFVPGKALADEFAQSCRQREAMPVGELMKARLKLRGEEEMEAP